MGGNRIFSMKGAVFGAIFIVSFVGSLYIFSLADLAPKGVTSYVKAVDPADNISAVFTGSSLDEAVDEEKSSVSFLKNPRVPERIVISKIGVDAPILNPNVSDNAVLNEKLKKGVVRYPDSGLLGDERNILLMGHASTLPGVQNDMYKVFSKIRELNLGDRFKIYSENRVYFYKVVEMTLTDKSEAKIDFNSGKREVTLSTCNTLGKKSERFIVRAEFVESFPLDG